MRKPLVVGNWKMNGDKRANAELLQGLIEQFEADELVQMAVCPPAAYLAQAEVLLADSAIMLGAQDVSSQANGAYTGEHSTAMLQDFGCEFAIIGHSERREYHGESDDAVAHKCQTLLQAGLTPIVCVGESLAEREAEQTLKVIERQLSAVINLIGLENLDGVVIAYEPVWAIGTGLTATPEQAQDVHAFIRAQLAQQGAATRILYGGSVKPSNAAELFAMADIDGALVGGASLKAADFNAIAAAAK